MSSSAFTPTQTQITNNVPTNVPVVEAWQSYNLTIGATTTAPTPGTILVNEARWRRVGDSMEIYYSLRTSTAGTIGSGVYLFPLPSGYTVDSSKMSPAGTGSSGAISIVGPAEVERSSIVYAGAAFLYNSTNIAIQVGATGQAISLVGQLYTLDVALKYTFRAVVPIAEWAGSGTTTLATRAVEEYVSNGAAAGNATSDLTDFKYGPSGSLIGNITAANGLVRRVRFQTPLLATDNLIVEVSTDRVMWFPMTCMQVVNGAPIDLYLNQNGTRYGMGRLEKANSTDIDVTFGAYSFSQGATYGSAGNNWATVGAGYWRVRRVSAGSQIGYPVSARNIIGDTSGTTVPTGMIGENYTALQSTNIAAGSSGSYKNVTSLQLTQGIWDVSYIGWVDGNGATGWVGTNSVCALSTTTASSAGTVNTTTLQYGTNGSVNNQVTSMRGNVIINISSTTTYYLNLSTTYTGGTPQLYGNIIARRIA